MLLGTKIVERINECNCNCCCCQEGDVDEDVVSSLDAPLCFDDTRCQRFLTVSLGIFSVVRITRPGQFLVQATDCAIPEKECCPVEEDDPCHVFRNMPFPIGEFSVGSVSAAPCGNDRPTKRCGC